ncbi:MAG: AraC family transcriptional regulator [Gammaproteobacteria bacterium]|nr:AraC family transcriptional regulator [Gammaproteobacteria bacterium]
MPHKNSTKLSHKERVNTIIEYIDAHIENPVSRLDLDTLASVACLSHYHISRIFKSHTGEGIHQYVKRRRLENSAKQLLYSKKPIQRIAESSSYNNFPAFTKAFKQYFGCSPSHFREKKNTVRLL